MKLKNRILLFVVASVVGQHSLTANAAPVQPLRTSKTSLAPIKPDVKKRWPAYFRYSVTSDYADNRSPRGYNHALGASLSYNINSNWTLGLETELRAEAIKGQIEKGTEESYTDVLNPSASLSLSYNEKFFGRHAYALFSHASPQFDDPSRREGYKGLVGGGGSVVLNFFGNAYSVGNTLAVTSLLNTFSYAADGSSNPDYFYNYRFDNSVRFWGNNKFTVSFGAKVTRYMDGFLGYTYNSSYTLSRSWNNLTIGASYVSGGFTDQGTVSLWYLNEYRRVATVMANYAF